MEFVIFLWVIPRFVVREIAERTQFLDFIFIEIPMDIILLTPSRIYTSLPIASKNARRVLLRDFLLLLFFFPRYVVGFYNFQWKLNRISTESPDRNPYNFATNQKILSLIISWRDSQFAKQIFTSHITYTNLKDETLSLRVENFLWQK